KRGSGYGWVDAKYVKKYSAPVVKVLFKGKVTASTLNVRSSNSPKAKVIGSLKRNATVEVVQSSNGWYKIKRGSGYGWVSAKYVKKIYAAPKVLFKGKVTASTLNVRSSNSPKAKKIGSLKRNSIVEVVQSSNGWYKIKRGSGYGWVSASYVKRLR
ncbi:SH3 domain-containing protein, partial [Mesobacillus zeae]|uniref:SH3 domain-containing protein n=1 Tax=Mesobacillus zeae TaxID=1917180 RepID=UPI00300932E8